MAAGKWKMYANAKLAWANGEIDFDSHSFKINLYTSASNANNLSSISQLADITNQVATGNGYTQNSKAVTITTANSSGTIIIDETSNPQWTAVGGSIVARFAVIYDDTHANDIPCFVCLLDTTPADITVNADVTFVVECDVSGLLRASGAITD